MTVKPEYSYSDDGKTVTLINRDEVMREAMHGCFVKQVRAADSVTYHDLTLTLTRRLTPAEFDRVEEWLKAVNLAGVLEFPK